MSALRTKSICVKASRRQHLAVGVFLFSSLWGMLTQAADITALRSWRAPDNTRIVLDLSGPVKVVQSPDSSPARLVIEIDGAQLKLANDRITSPDGPVKMIRLNSGAGGTVRLVLDLGAEVSPRIFQLPPNEKYGHRLVLDLYDRQTDKSSLAGVADKPLAEKSVNEKPGTEKPVAEKAIADKAVVDKTVVDKSVIDKTTAQPEKNVTRPAVRVPSTTAVVNAASVKVDAPVSGAAVPSLADKVREEKQKDPKDKDKAADRTAVDPLMVLAEKSQARMADARVPDTKPVVADKQDRAEKSDKGQEDKSSAREKQADKVVDKGSSEKTAIPERTTPPEKVTPKGRKIIIAIDAGHGGDDTGAIGPSNVYEKNVTLAIARTLKATLDDEPGFVAMLTRDGDYFIPLKDRRQIARQKYKADIFVSIHADASPSRSAKGASVFALSLKGANTATSRFARALADRENKADLIGGVPVESRDDVLVNVLADMVVEGSLEHSLHMGRNILDELDGFSALHAKSVEQAGFAVLKEPGMVSLLVENGFISNPDEEKKLTDPAYQKRLAHAIASGVRRYAEQYPMPGTYFSWLSEQKRKRVERVASLDKPTARTEARKADPVSAEKQEKAAARKHKIAKGESLSLIAEKYQVKLASLREANRLESDEVRIGQVLKIPN